MTYLSEHLSAGFMQSGPLLALSQVSILRGNLQAHLNKQFKLEIRVSQNLATNETVSGGVV